MTAEPKAPGSVPPLPAWCYWTFMSLAAAIPVLLVGGIAPAPWDTILAAMNAAFAVLTGTTRPAGKAERGGK